MAKFENSTFVKLWNSNEGRLIMSTILADENLIRSNYMFWASKFRVDPSICPTDEKGRSTFVSELRERKQGALMDLRAPLSHNTPTEAGEVHYYTGTIPSFSAKEYVENASERMYKEKMFEQFGDAALIAEFATEYLQIALDSGNQTLSHMSAQLLSTGRLIVDWGEGIGGNILDCNVPAENRLTAGTSAWSDTSFDLLGHLRDIVSMLNDKHGNMNWQLEITRDKFNNTFLKNTGVIDWIKAEYAARNGMSGKSEVPTAVISVDNAITALAKLEGIPTIVIIDEKQKDVVLGTVSGWEDKYAVIRPGGYAGYIRHATPIERDTYTKYGAKAISKVMVPALRNLGLVINTELDNGELREWHSEFIMNAIPSLDEFMYHYIIDTTQADA